jgi:hypothetical protein
MEKKYNKETDFNAIKNEIRTIVKQCYDDDTRVLVGSGWTRGSVSYNYVPAEYMEEGIPFIVSSSISYDGGKAYDRAIESGAMHMHFKELSTVFTMNNFVD